MSGLVPIVLIGIVAIFLVVHDQYEDGLIGRIALGGIVLAAMMAVLTHTGNFGNYEFSPEMTLFLWSVCLFMVRHAYRFWRYSTSGKFRWGAE